jgi:predicted secreted protein
MGLARRKGAVEEIVQILLKEGIGIIQLPCPETNYFGLRRFWAVREQLDNPGFNDYCKKLSQKIRDIVSEYMRNGYEVVGVIGINGSPSCGVTESGSSEDWIGPPNKAGEHVRVKKPGVFMEKLREDLKDLQFIEWDWKNTESSISKIKELIKQSKARKDSKNHQILL